MGAQWGYSARLCYYPGEYEGLTYLLWRCTRRIGSQRLTTQVSFLLELPWLLAVSQVTFMADAANVHRVTEVTAGERLTLTLWFTLQPEHSEDTAVLRQLSPGALVPLLLPSLLCVFLCLNFSV